MNRTSLRGNGKRHGQLALALTLVLALPLLPHPVAAQADGADTEALLPNVAYAWWGPTDATGWHFRLPVLVRPALPDPVTKHGIAEFPGGLGETPVTYEVDFTDAVRRTGAEGKPGWPADDFGRLASFTFDPSSVRVVAYDRTSGEIDTGKGRSGLVPSTFTPLLYENKEGRNGVYNATQNAIGTLRWIVPAPFDAPRLYYVYFDTVENAGVAKKPAVTWTEAELGPLRSVDFLRPATDLYGYFPYVPELPPARVYVWALHSNTTVEMYRYRYAGFDPQLVPACAKKGSIGLCLSGGRYVEEEVVLSCPAPRDCNNGGRGSFEVTTSMEPTEPFFFRIVASRPVHAMIGPATLGVASFETDYWVPSVDGSLLGNSFSVPLVAGPYSALGGPQNGVFVVAGETPVLISVTSVDSSGSRPQGQPPIQLAPREAKRVIAQGVQSADSLILTSNSPDQRFLVGLLPYYLHHGNQGLSIAGAPVGTTMVSTPTVHNHLVVLPHESGTVSMYDAEKPDKQHPTDGPQALTAGPQNLWNVPGTVFLRQDFGQNGADLSGHMWISRSSGLVSTFAGDRGLDIIGGVDGKEFYLYAHSVNALDKVEAKAFVMPLYPATRVDIERYDPVRDRMVNVYGRVVGPDTPVSTMPGSVAPVIHGNYTDPGMYRIKATKPVVVYRYADQDPDKDDVSFSYSTYLGGTHRSPIAVVGDVQFYGPLVSWASKVDQRTVKPGDQVVFTATVTNLGRDVDGKPLLDDVNFILERPKDAPDWPEPRLSTAFAGRVPGGGSVEVTVVQEVPKDAKTDTTLDLAIVAVSGLNDAIRDKTVLEITVQTRYEIEAAFRANNRATLQSVIEPSTTREFPVRVKNVGSGPDGVTFTMLRANPFGFEADIVWEETPGDKASRQSFLDVQGLPRLGIDGRPVSLPLGVGEEKTVFLVVKAPGGSDPAQHNFVLEATSAADSSSRKQLQLVALTNAKTALRIRALNSTFDVAPGLNSTLQIEVQNDGIETAIDMSYRAAELAGWNLTLDPVRFELRSPGVVDPRDGTPLDRRIVNLTVRAGPDAPVGFIFPVEVTAASATRVGEAEPPSAKVLVTAAVVNNFTLLVPELLERSVLPGATIEYDLPVQSLANGNFTVSPVATKLPAGWTLASGPASRFSLSPGDERTVSVTLSTRPNEAAGMYAGEFGFVMEDELGRRGVALAPFAVRMKRHVDYTAVPEDEFVVSPGGVTRGRFLVTNTGNVNLSLELSARAPEGWLVELVDANDTVVPLAPGASKVVDLRITAPATPVGDVVEIDLQGDVPLELERTTPFAVTVLRDDLRILEVKAMTERFRVGDPSVFQVTLVNDGTVPRTNVDVALRVDGRVVRNVTVRSLPPGEPRTVQVPWNVVPARTLDFIVDAENAYSEEDETNNVRTFDLAGATRANAPAPGWLLALAAIGALALARRRWRQ